MALTGTVYNSLKEFTLNVHRERWILAFPRIYNYSVIYNVYSAASSSSSSEMKNKEICGSG